MFQPNASDINELERLNSSYKFSHSHDGVTCEIVDLTTNQVYVKHKCPAGTSEPDALSAAVIAARTADKPLTPAQAADKTIQAKDAEIAELKRKLAAASASTEQEPATVKRGRFGRPVPAETAASTNEE